MANGKENELSANSSTLIIIQLISRTVSFILNILLLRATSAVVLGIVHAKFDLFYRTIISLSREAIRNTLLSFDASSKAGDVQRKKLVAMSLISLVIAVPLSITFLFLSLRYWRPESTIGFHVSTQAYSISLILFMLSALLEISSEGAYQITLRKNGLKSRLWIESSGNIIKAILTLALSFLFKNYFDALSAGFYACAIGQIAYSSIYFIGMNFSASDSLVFCLPWSQNLDRGTVRRIGVLLPQTWLKFSLEQSHWIILSTFAAPESQGIYAMITNYGSLPMRLFLQPIDEAAMAFFSQSAVPLGEKLGHLAFLIKLCFLVSLFASTFVYPLFQMITPMKYLTYIVPLTLFINFLPFAAAAMYFESFLSSCSPIRLISCYQRISLLIALLAYPLGAKLTLIYGCNGLVFGSIFNALLRSIAAFFMITGESELIHALPSPKIILAFLPVVFYPLILRNSNPLLVLAGVIRVNPFVLIHLLVAITTVIISDYPFICKLISLLLPQRPLKKLKHK